jgi:diacylglycerol kinase
MQQEKFSIQKRLDSFSFAFNGLRILLKEEHNSRIHLIAAIIAIALGFILGLSATEWILLILCIGLVFSMEILNSALEKLSDFSSPGKNEMIKKVKDLSAAAVLVSAITALLIGIIIFLPKILLYV